jgi:hypothetical protein
MRYLHLRAAVVLLLAATAAPLSEAQAAPETFNTALPVAKGEFIFREQFVFRRKGDDPSAADRDMEILGGISVLGYGATSDLALFGVVPWLDKRLEFTDSSGRRIARSTRGIGDVQFFGRYTLFQKEVHSRNRR